MANIVTIAIVWVFADEARNGAKDWHYFTLGFFAILAAATAYGYWPESASNSPSGSAETAVTAPGALEADVATRTNLSAAE